MTMRGGDVPTSFSKDPTRTRAAAELKVVPAGAWALAGLALVCAPFLFMAMLANRPDAPPAWAQPLLGVLLGLVVGAYLLLLGYINRDAKRRGMSPVLWTIVALFVPNGLGFILYFVLRQPRRSSCPQCGEWAETGFAFCPRCGARLSPSCPQCQRAVGVHDVYCPHCGTPRPEHVAPLPGPQPSPTQSHPISG